MPATFLSIHKLLGRRLSWLAIQLISKRLGILTSNLCNWLWPSNLPNFGVAPIDVFSRLTVYLAGFRNEGRPSQALTSALRLQPGNLEAIFYRGICQFQAGSLDDSRSLLESVARALPDEPYVHLYLGMIAEREGKPDEALAEFHACERLDSHFEVAVYKAGYVLAKAGRFQDAAVQFQKVIALDPNNAAAHRNLALAYARSGDEGAARSEFDAACRLNAAMCASEHRP